MGTVISFKKMAARLRGKKDDEPGLTSGEKRAMMEMASAIVLTAAKNEDALFFANVDEHNNGLKILRGTARYQFMKAVFEDSLQRFLTLKTGFDLGDLNTRNYWSFPDRPNRAYFASPAHVCRTHEMAVALWRNNQVDFRLPDSEGHLSLYFMARYAKDTLVIPAVTDQFNLNANCSGVDKLTRQPFDAPLIRAVKFGNIYAVRSLEGMSPKKVDINQRTVLGLTPLMLAVLEAENALDKRFRGETSARDVAKRLWIVRFLAEAFHSDHELTDPLGLRAVDFAASPQTRDALAAGIAKKEAFIQRFMPPPKPGI